MVENEVVTNAPVKQEAPAVKISFRLPLWIYTVGALLIVWEVYGRLTDGALSLPPFSEVLVSIWSLLADGRLLSSLWTSLQGLVFGFALAVIIGVPLGLLMGFKPLADRALAIYLDILTAVPMVAIIPLVVVFFGLGLASRIVIIFLFAVVIIVENTRTGVKDADPQLLEMARSFGANPRQQIRRIFLPSAAPFMIAGIRLGLGRAIVGMVTAEMLFSSVGIGYLLMNATGRFQVKEVFAIVLALLVLSAVLIMGVQFLEKKWLKYRK
jgi:NitT/TauT family transport system permease protein